MAGPRSRLRLLALLSVAAWAVHQLRYALAYGSGQADALQRTGHGYLEIAGPLAGLLLLITFAQLLGTLARRRAGRGAAAPSLARTWALLTAVLLAVFSAQELLEGALSAGHAAGLGGLVGQGGWLAAPLALLAALGVALAAREADAATTEPAVRLESILRWRPAAPAVLAHAGARRPPRPPARRHAGRGPPRPAA